MVDKNVLKAVKKSNGWLRAYTTDLHGHFREILFPAKYYQELVTEGIAYDGSSFVGINSIEDSDSIYKGDEETLIAIPEELWDTDKEEYMIICDIYGKDGKPHPNCPRSMLKRVQLELSKAWDGGVLMTGAEPEAYFVDQDNEYELSDSDNSNYFAARDPYNYVITEIVDILSKMGFDIERSHSEVGKDQFEINWRYDVAERTADRVQIFKLYLTR
jgi:glutamine synthetase